MSTPKRVSDPSWTDSERANVLSIFLSRTDQALLSPLFQKMDTDDPSSGFTFHIQVALDKNTGEQKTSISIDSFDFSVYDDAIRLLRPFILSSEATFLPKITRHLQFLVPENHQECLSNFVAWVDQYVSFEKQYHPVFFSTFIGELGADDLVAGDSSEIALAYIYGESVKTDPKKRAFLKQFDDTEHFPIKMALTGFLVHLAKIAKTVQTQIRMLDRTNQLKVKIESN